MSNIWGGDCLVSMQNLSFCTTRDFTERLLEALSLKMLFLNAGLIYSKEQIEKELSAREG